MRIAILITGQPRHLDQGAWWLSNKVFPNGCGIEYDVFCHLWNDGSDDLIHRVKYLYNTENVIIDDYDGAIYEHIKYIRETNNTQYPDWKLVPTHFQENMLFNTEYPTEYGINWHGQFLSAGRATLAFEDKLRDYDIIIKTRSDAIMNDMSIKEWLSAFNNIKRNTVLSDKLFTEWLYIRAGQPFHGDFTFIGQPGMWIQYGTNIIPGLQKLCTRDKHLFGLAAMGEDNSFPSHWTWNMLNTYSKNDWLSFSVVWPTRYNVTLVRDENYVYDKTYQEIKNRYETVG
jgi:hypothetical protein